MTKDELLDIIEKWQWDWMNQTQNSVQDFQNYFNKSVGIDANMRHSLADRILRVMEGEHQKSVEVGENGI